MKKIAIVILNWNGAALLERFLPSVINHSKELANIYVADNGSTDVSIHVLETQFPSVKIIALQDNFGVAGGYNKA